MTPALVRVEKWAKRSFYVYQQKFVSQMDLTVATETGNNFTFCFLWGLEMPLQKTSQLQISCVQLK